MLLSLLLQIDTTGSATGIASQSIFDIILGSGPLGVTIIGIQLLLTIIAILQVVILQQFKEFALLAIHLWLEWWRKDCLDLVGRCQRLKVLLKM